MKISFKVAFLSFTILTIFNACNQSVKDTGDDSYLKGTAQFVADESFAPILDQELYIFKALNKEANPKIVYKSENDALRLFLNDSIRVAILSRDLKPDEVKLLKNRTLPADINRFAIDAVTVIVNQSSTDTTTSVNELKAILNGKIKTDRNIVFDNPNSSIVRYLKDFSGNSKFDQKNIYALKTNVEVIKYVSEHPKAIGFISFSWLNDPDKNYEALVNKVKVVGIKNEDAKKDAETYFKPSQTTLGLKQYPLIRGLYIINCTGKLGLGTGFESFLVSDRGQRIVLKSGLLPDSIPGREVIMSK